MDRKRFFLILGVILVTAAVAWVIRYRQPQVDSAADWSRMPLTLGDWYGRADSVAAEVIDLLRPNSVFNADYYGPDGVQVNLFLGDWSEAREGPHSPMNCVPASGWTLENIQSHPIEILGRRVEARRLRLQFHETKYLMDYWYITPYGETGNEYKLKLYEMATSLTLRPRHLTFVRLVTHDTDAGRAGLERFEQDFAQQIYACLPVESH